ncbi:MAG TPA: hypothetical protein VJT49_09870 [Amycolatopsis sp.]|uniref:hypothetical protein n=1 Tax=Amycolatopsis sp. TaxID=37632 RepID=UPI002B4A4478|nr:hypothetical protein [Amycolatopsis sp.]HKS45405.1 hypothetical protein [Amycolatopsis sp.]
MGGQPGGTITKLVVLGGAVTAASLAFRRLFHWWHASFTQLAGGISGSAAEVDGIVFAARTLFVFVLGAFFGAVLRRTVAAMAATGFAVALVTVLVLRPRFMPPITDQATGGPAGKWILSTWWTDLNGRRPGQGRRAAAAEHRQRLE